MSLFRTKPIDSIVRTAGEARGLKRVLGPANLVALGIGAIIGTGIFVLTGQAAADHAGPGIVISMVLAGVVSALAASVVVRRPDSAASAITARNRFLGDVALVANAAALALVVLESIPVYALSSCS